MGAAAVADVGYMRGSSTCSPKNPPRGKENKAANGAVTKRTDTREYKGDQEGWILRQGMNQL